MNIIYLPGSNSSSLGIATVVSFSLTIGPFRPRSSPQPRNVSELWQCGYLFSYVVCSSQAIRKCTELLLERKKEKNVVLRIACPTDCYQLTNTFLNFDELFEQSSFYLLRLIKLINLSARLTDPKGNCALKYNSKRIIVRNKGYTNLRYTLALKNSTFLNVYLQ